MARTVLVFTPYWERELEEIVDDRVIAEVAEAVADDAARNSPRRTGRLKRSYGVVKPRRLVRWIGSSLWRWRFTELGTATHEIRAGKRSRSGRTRPVRGAIAWPGMAADHPVAAARHPGGPAFHPLKRALYKKRAI